MIFQHMKVKDGATALMIVVVGTALLKIEIIENEVFFIVKVWAGLSCSTWVDWREMVLWQIIEFKFFV